MSISRLAVDFSMNFPGVHTTLCGANRMAHLERNLDSIRKPLSAEEQACLDFIRKKYTVNAACIRLQDDCNFALKFLQNLAGNFVIQA